MQWIDCWQKSGERKYLGDARLEGLSLSYTAVDKSWNKTEYSLKKMMSQGGFKLFPLKSHLMTPNDIHTTTNSFHILTGSQRRLTHRQWVTPNDIHTQLQTAAVIGRFKSHKDSGSPNKKYTTVEVHTYIHTYVHTCWRNTAQLVQAELLTFNWGMC